MHKLIQTVKNKLPNWLKIVIISISLILLFQVIVRVWQSIALRRETNILALTVVQTVTATQTSDMQDDIVLPGTLTAWHEAPIYARTNGYIKQWYVDIGSAVNKGDLLAVIETPELDAQLAQAEANLKIAEANNKLAQTTAERWKNLLKTESVSQQETDEKVDIALASTASVIAARANRDRLLELVNFEKVKAPFNGIISTRATDIGALINSGSNPSEAQPLFRIVQIDPLRLYVKIPEIYSSRITPNMEVYLNFTEYPGQRFLTHLKKTAHSIDPSTRTLLAQFVVENKSGKLLPGSYTEVHFSIKPYPGAVRLPVNTLIFRKEGLQVAILDKSHRVILKNITVSRDFGDYVEIDSGIKLGEEVITNPPDSIYEGEQMRLAAHGKKSAPV